MSLRTGIKSAVRSAMLRVASKRRRADMKWLASKTRLHLGCGSAHVPGFLNIDAQAGARGADLICNLEELERVYPEGNAELIYACHVLEHFSHRDADQLLGVFYRLLREGGELRLSVPDMDRIVRVYAENWTHFRTPGNGPWHGLIWGGQEDEFDFHKTGFNLCWLRFLLERWGFHDVAEYPHEPHFLGIADGSLAKEPFGQFISLNVVVFK